MLLTAVGSVEVCFESCINCIHAHDADIERGHSQIVYQSPQGHIQCVMESRAVQRGALDYGF